MNGKLLFSLTTQKLFKWHAATFTDLFDLAISHGEVKFRALGEGHHL